MRRKKEAAQVVGALTLEGELLSRRLVERYGVDVADAEKRESFDAFVREQIAARGAQAGEAEVREPAVPPRVTFGDLRIQTKDQRLVVFEPNAVQALYLDALCAGWREGEVELRGVKEIILKARQFGFSTLIAALFFLDTINNPNTTTVLMAHDGPTSEELFQMVQRFYDLLPDEKRPKTKYNSRRQLYWPSINSRFLVRAAGSGGVGRALTIHNLHCSEAAFYKNRRLLTGLLQAVPSGGNVFIESTANGEAGVGQVYHDEYQSAKSEKAKLCSGNGAFSARFYAWWQHEEYERAVPEGWERSAEEESAAGRLELDARFGVERANRKLVWRRAKQAEPGMGNLFAQEYPGDDKEAFLVSGQRYFTEWDEARFGVFLDEVTVERYWTFFGGYDWGHYAPACFLLACVDERGRVLILDEEYHRGLTDPEQAQKVLECLARWNLKPADVTVWADPAMWVAKTDHAGRKVANVAAFHAAGLRFVPAANERVPGWSNVRRYLHDVDSVNAEHLPESDAVKTLFSPEGGLPVRFLRVVRGRCANLIRTLPLQNHDTRRPEDVDSTGEDHAADSLRYLLASRPRPSGGNPDQKPAPDYTPGWLKRSLAAKKRKL